MEDRILTMREAVDEIENLDRDNAVIIDYGEMAMYQLDEQMGKITFRQALELFDRDDVKVAIRGDGD